MKAYETTAGKCWTAMHVLQNHVQAELQKRNAGINVEQLLLLMELDWEDGLRPTVLAERMLRSKGTISSLIRHAERSALIASAADPSNRNAKRIFLTQKGKQLHDELAPVVTNLLRESVSHVSSEHQKIVQEAMNGIIRTFHPEWFEH